MEEFNTYRARVQQVTFSYPKSWVPRMLIETNPIGQEEFGYVEVPGTARPSLAYFAVGKPATIDKQATEPERDFDIITSSPVQIPNWPGEVRYVEAIIDNGDGQGFWVMYGLSSPNDVINEVKTVRSRQDILPLILKDQSTPNPGEGLLVFFGSVFGFVSKALAQDFFKDQTYLQVKNMMLSTAFTAPPAPAPALTPLVGQADAGAPAGTTAQPTPAPTPPADQPSSGTQPTNTVQTSQPADTPAATPGAVTTPTRRTEPEDDPTTLRIQR